MKWTPELTARVIHLRSVENLTGTQIAKEMGLNKNQVVGKLSRAGLWGGPATWDKRQRDTSRRKLLLNRKPHGWDDATFMPWEHRKQLRKMEREQGLPFRALETGYV